MIDQQSVERAAERFSAPEGSFERLALRRDRRQRNRRIQAGVLGFAIAIAVGWLGVNAIRSTPSVPADPTSTEELGIFAPVAGHVVYGKGWTGIYAVDPEVPEDRAARVQLTSDRAIPLGWSSDGTELLFTRFERSGPDRSAVWDLVILHADGSETQVTTDLDNFPSATISPDGSRVVFAAGGGIYVVDADGGPAEVLVETPGDGVYDPTFSPDGTQVAYAAGAGDHSHHIWVTNADGTDAHEIVFNESTAGAGHVGGLAWSPAGDRIALGLDAGGIFTFAPDGSGFTQVISSGDQPYWSPDGSQIAYTILCDEKPDGCGLAIADADGANVRSFDFGTSGPWHPAGGIQRDEEPPLRPATGELVLHLHSWRPSYVEVAVYADGRVIWVADERGNLQQRLTREGVERLRSRAVSTGLFEHDLALLGLVVRGNMEVRRGDQSVIVAWGRVPFNVAGLGLRDRSVEATSAQSGELRELEAFFRDPTAWGLPRDMYRQPEITPFVPTHLGFGYDRAVPDWSILPSPAREIVTSQLEPVMSDRCNVISIDQAREVVDALVQAGELAPIDDIRLGFSFDLGPSFVWFDPALPHEVDCP